jgi:HNH endonuclease
MSNFGIGMLGVLPLPDDEARKLTVWAKGTPMDGFDAAVWRYDAFGHAMRFSDYGNRNSDYGWEIDHIVATAVGGSDDISNLRPLHHRMNSSLGATLRGLLSG